MDLHFTFSEIQANDNTGNISLKKSKETPTDLLARLDIPQSALFRVFLQDQDLLKSFLHQIPTILLNDVVQEKKTKKILQTAGLNEVKLLQERWKSRMDQDSRDEARCDLEKARRQSQLLDKHHEPTNDSNSQKSSPQLIPGMPITKRPIETTVQRIRTTLEALENEQRRILNDPERISLIVSEGTKAYYAVDKALKFMAGLYPSLPTMFEVPYRPGCIISSEVGYSPGHPLMSDKLAQFYEQVFGTCTKLHFRFRTILEHYEIELNKRFHGLPPGARTLEVLEESLTIWFRNLCTSAKYVAAIERAELTKDYSTLIIMRQTADSLGGVSTLLKLAMPHALVPPPPPTMSDILNLPLPSTHGGTAHFKLRVSDDGASFAEICSNEPVRQCVGLLRSGQREYSLSGGLTNVAGPLADSPTSSTANDVAEGTSKEIPPSQQIQSSLDKGKKRLPSISTEARKVKSQESEAGYYEGDDSKTLKASSTTSEVPKKRSTTTGKRGRARKVVLGEDVEATPTPSKRTKKRHNNKDDKLEVPTASSSAIHQPVPQYPPHNVNMMIDDFGMGSLQDTGAPDMNLPDPFPNNNYPFPDQNQGMPMPTGFDYGFLDSMQMGNQQYAPVAYCPVSQNLYHAATAFLGYNPGPYDTMPQLQGDQGNIDALACLSDAALGFPPVHEGVISGNTGEAHPSTQNNDDNALFEQMSFMPVIKMEEATSEAEDTGIGIVGSDQLKQEREENDADGFTDEEWNMV